MSNDEKKLSSSKFIKNNYFHYQTRNVLTNPSMTDFREKFIVSYNGDIEILVEQVDEFVKPEEKLAAK